MSENETSECQAVRPVESGQIMSVSQMVAQHQMIKDLMKKVFVKDLHYGIIPGTERKDRDGNEIAKPTLLKAGAEKLSVMFRLSPSYEIQESFLEGGHREYRITCTLTHIPTGEVWGTGVGQASTMESRHRYRKGERVCPTCGNETIIKGKAEYGGGWICFQKKGGCGAKFSESDPAITEQVVGRMENDNPADQVNTVLKMGKKRALTDATLTCTGASDFFTQDKEDQRANAMARAGIDEQEPPSKETVPAPQNPLIPPEQPASTTPPANGASQLSPAVLKFYEAVNGDLGELERLSAYAKDDGGQVPGVRSWSSLSDGRAKSSLGRWEREQKARYE
jgi:hypothetical protein